MVADLVLLGLGIALQPFRLSAFILILSSKDGTRKGAGFIAGWLACLVLVIAAVAGITGGRPVRFRTIPGTALLVGKLAPISRNGFRSAGTSRLPPGCHRRP